MYRTLPGLALAGFCMAAATQAHAQAIGYLETEFGAIDYATAVSTAGAGQYTVSTIGTGQYIVTFYGLGNGLNSNVQVNAVDTLNDPHYCTSAGWYSPNGQDVNVAVDCFDHNGNPVGNSGGDDFSVFYEARSAAPATGAIAFLWANQPTSTVTYTPASFWNYNSTGGLNQVTRLSQGLYRVQLGGLTKLNSNAEVTAYGGGAARCEIDGWSSGVSGSTVYVYCVNAAGAAADEYFNLAFTAGTTQAASSVTPYGSYVWASNPTSTSYTPSLSYQWNNLSSKKQTIFNGEGTSFLTLQIPMSLPVPSGGAFGMASAYGAAGEYCNTNGPGFYSENKKFFVATMTVTCYNAQGQVIPSYYAATMFLR